MLHISGRGRTLVIALYAGGFDPITNGHVDIAVRAAQLFEKVYIAVVDVRSSKSLMFSTEERVELCQEALSDYSNIEVITYTGLTVDLARKLGAKVMVRGLRMGSDFDYELELALNNQQLSPDIETICFMANLRYIHVQASLIKEIAAGDKDISHLVPNNVAVVLRDRFRSRV
jgi:pantetheine-phosphate adenylyltransferase